MKKSGNRSRKQNLDRDTPEMKWDHKMFEYRYGMEPLKPRVIDFNENNNKRFIIFIRNPIIKNQITEERKKQIFTIKKSHQ